MIFFCGYTNFFVQGMMPGLRSTGLGPGRHGKRAVGRHPFWRSENNHINHILGHDFDQI